MAQLGTLSEYAAHRGVAPSYVTKLRKGGRLVMVKDSAGRPAVDFEQSDRLVRETTDMRMDERSTGKASAAAAALPQETAHGDRIGAVFRQAQAKERAFSAQMAELQFGKASGRLVERARVEAAVFDAFRSLRDRVLAVPRRCAPVVLGLTDVRAIELAITDELRRALGGDEAGAVADMQARVLG